MLRIYPSVFNGTLKAPAAADHAQRLLFMSSIPALDTTVCNIPDCDDVDSAIGCLTALGCEVQRFGNSCAVKPFPKNVPLRTVSLDFGQSTTASRIAIALAAASASARTAKPPGRTLT